MWLKGIAFSSCVVLARPKGYTITTSAHGAGIHGSSKEPGSALEGDGTRPRGLVVLLVGIHV